MRVMIDERSVVRVSGEACGSLSVGGGVAVESDLVVTNAHVVAGVVEVSVDVIGTDEPFEGTVLGFDAVRDLAAVQVTGADLTPVEVHDGDEGPPLRLVTVSDDGRMEERPTDGGRSIVATGDDIYRRPGARRAAIELDVAVAPGVSGSGLFNDRGEVVGVVFATSRRDDARSYAVAASEVIAFLDDVVAEGESAGPCLSRPLPEPVND